jgi:phage gp46-like protein
MPDLSLAFNPELFEFDFALGGELPCRDLQGDDGLLTAVIISLFTDCRAHDDDPLPDERVGVPSDMRGWWGDYFEQEKTPDPIGSRLWLLWREKEMPVVVARAQEYASEALAWLTRDGHAAGIEVEAVHAAPRMLVIRVMIDTLPGGTEFAAANSVPPGEYGGIQGRREWNFVYDYTNVQPVIGSFGG